MTRHDRHEKKNRITIAMKLLLDEGEQSPEGVWMDRD